MWYYMNCERSTPVLNHVKAKCTLYSAALFITQPCAFKWCNMVYILVFHLCLHFFSLLILCCFVYFCVDVTCLHFIVRHVEYKFKLQCLFLKSTKPLPCFSIVDELVHQTSGTDGHLQHHRACNASGLFSGLPGHLELPWQPHSGCSQHGRHR